MKLAIGIPTHGTIKTKTFVSIVRFVKSVDYDVPVITQIGSYIQDNREVIVETAIANGMTHLLFIDHDMIFEPDAVQKLIDHDKDIIGAPFNLRGDPPVTTLKNQDHTTGERIWEEEPSGLVRCCAVGTGFVLINLDVFKKLEQPWFRLDYDKSGKFQTGEDIYFCRQARKAGFDVWADLTIKLGHIGDYIY